MKATLKTILLVSLAVIDCIVGGYILTKNNQIKKERINEKPVKIIEFGEILEMDEDSLMALVIEDKKSQVVFEDMTLDELSNKLERSLNDDLSGKGELIASYSLEKGVDPYIATAIMLQETGCKWKCSRIVKTCNNVGGQKGKGCGSYHAYSSLDEGIKAFINGLSKNYFSKGLTTTKQINKKYATSKTWYKKVDAYIAEIKKK